MRNIQKVYFLATLPVSNDFNYESLEDKHFWQAYFYILDFFNIIQNNSFKLFKDYVYSETLSYELLQIKQTNDKQEALAGAELKEYINEQIYFLIDVINAGDELEKNIINLSQRLYLFKNNKNKLKEDEILQINNLQDDFSFFYNANISYLIKS